MHRDAYQVVRPPSCLAILIRNMSILRQNTKAALFCAPGLKADANTLQNQNPPHMNCLPFLGHKKWEAVQNKSHRLFYV